MITARRLTAWQQRLHCLSPSPPVPDSSRPHDPALGIAPLVRDSELLRVANPPVSVHGRHEGWRGLAVLSIQTSCMQQCVPEHEHVGLMHAV